MTQGGCVAGAGTGGLTGGGGGNPCAQLMEGQVVYIGRWVLALGEQESCLLFMINKCGRSMKEILAPNLAQMPWPCGARVKAVRGGES
jgi:hypothetical protein